MKIANKIPIAGVLMPPEGKKPGRFSRNGSGTSVWSWGTNLSPNRCAPPNSHLPFHQPKSLQLLLPAIPLLRSPCRSNRAASPGATLPFSLMAPCIAQLGRRSVQPKSAGRLMGACGWCMRLASASVEAVTCANSVNGMAATHRSHVGSACCSIRSRSAQLPYSGKTGVAGSIVELVCSSCVTNGSMCTWSLPASLARPRLHPCFLVPSALILGSRGRSDWPTMPLPQRLVDAQSRCSGCRKALPPRWVCSLRNTAIGRRWISSPREGRLLRAHLHAFFAQIFLCFSHLLFFLLHPPLFFFSLLGTSSCSEGLSLPHLAINSSTGSLRNSWAWRLSLYTRGCLPGRSSGTQCACAGWEEESRLSRDSLVYLYRPRGGAYRANAW